MEITSPPSSSERVSMPAFLLAAGRGERLAPLTDTLPKCLAPILGKPLLGYWLELLTRAGIGPLLVNTCYLREMVERYVAESPWRNDVTLLREKELLGTGGTLLANRNALDGGPFIVVHADNLSRFSVEDFVAAHRQRPKGCLITMMLFRTPTPESCGIVDRDTQGVVTAFYEKSREPHGDLANGAVYIMEPEVFGILDSLETPTPDISLDLIPRCMGRIFTWVNNDYHRDIGTPESYAAAEREFASSNR